MDQYLANLTTENSNKATQNIDSCSTQAMLEMINDEDQKVAEAVRLEIPNIAKAVDACYQALANGGKLFYFGAGTSGRLGVLDASECPPTFSTPPSLVQAYIAGGDTALRTAVEGSEDDAGAGAQVVRDAGVTEKDVVVGISASGSAAYVLAAVNTARALGACTIAVVTNKGTRLGAACHIAIEPVVGPEVIAGSTRLKSGTAQKLVLNMLSTGSMIKLGKVYHNLMVDVCPSNKKLIERSKRIIMEVTDVGYDQAAQALERYENNVKLAIVGILGKMDVVQAKQTLNRELGNITSVLSKNAL